MKIADIERAKKKLQYENEAEAIKKDIHSIHCPICGAPLECDISSFDSEESYAKIFCGRCKGFEHIKRYIPKE